MRKMMFLIIGILSVSVIIGCLEGTTSINHSPTDVVTVTDVNKYITEQDKKEGITPTRNTLDPVPMSHLKHEEAGVACVVCHHKENNDDRIKQCAACHKGSAGEDTLHMACINCHGKVKEGPKLCHECHIPKK